MATEFFRVHGIKMRERRQFLNKKRSRILKNNYISKNTEVKVLQKVKFIFKYYGHTN